jgi:adenine C2-methylase RlmN of 23S rRNA A2503 and tRNA A37
MVSKINIIDINKISENQYSYSRSYTYAELIDGLDRQGIEIGLRS